MRTSKNATVYFNRKTKDAYQAIAGINSTEIIFAKADFHQEANQYPLMRLSKRVTSPVKSNHEPQILHCVLKVLTLRLIIRILTVHQ